MKFGDSFEETEVVLVAWIFIIFAIIYFVIILYFFVGIYRIKESKSTESPFVSVLVPARNEQQNIRNCLRSLDMQTYPSHLFEVIVIDDQSVDQTAAVVKKYIQGKSNFQLLLHQAENIGPTFKKHALKFGMEKVRGEIILTVDADTLVQPRWIEKMVSCYDENTGLVAGIITYLPGKEKNLFYKLQTLEFTGLVFCGVGALGNRNPIMCNGSNLSFRKSAFNEVGGYDSNLHLASGDDDLLLQNIHNKTNWQVKYLLNREAINFTLPVANLSGLLNQRIRWASKAIHYPSKWIFATLLSIYLLYLMIFILFPLMVFGFFPWKLYLIGVCLKFFPEILVISKGLEIVGRHELLPLFPFAQIFQIPFILYSGFMGLFKKFSWGV